MRWKIRQVLQATEEGRHYMLDMSRKEERCVVHCEDGNFTMPRLAIVFQEEA